jgi:hypothetical protein
LLLKKLFKLKIMRLQSVKPQEKNLTLAQSEALSNSSLFKERWTAARQ